MEVATLPMPQGLFLMEKAQAHAQVHAQAEPHMPEQSQPPPRGHSPGQSASQPASQSASQPSTPSASASQSPSRSRSPSPAPPRSRSRSPAPKAAEAAEEQTLSELALELGLSPISTELMKNLVAATYYDEWREEMGLASESEASSIEDEFPGPDYGKAPISLLPDWLKFTKIDEDYELVQQLGEGTHGSVHRVRPRGEEASSSGEFAAKMFSCDDVDVEVLTAEIEALAECQSQHVVVFRGVHILANQVWLLMELCAGSILDVINETGLTLTEAEIRSVVAQVLLGLKVIHAKRFIHRDVKAANILVTRRGEVRVADFGILGRLRSRRHDTGGESVLVRRASVIGTSYWMAPEIIEELDDGYNELADIWSVGITAMEMADGEPPRFNMHPSRAMFLISSQPAPALTKDGEWSQAFHHFVARCLDKDPRKRATVTELLDHPFVRREVGVLSRADGAGGGRGCAPDHPFAVLRELLKMANKPVDEDYEEEPSGRKGAPAREAPEREMTLPIPKGESGEALERSSVRVYAQDAGRPPPPEEIDSDDEYEQKVEVVAEHVEDEGTGARPGPPAEGPGPSPAEFAADDARSIASEPSEGPGAGPAAPAGEGPGPRLGAGEGPGPRLGDAAVSRLVDENLRIAEIATSPRRAGAARAHSSDSNLTTGSAASANSSRTVGGVGRRAEPDETLAPLCDALAAESSEASEASSAQCLPSLFAPAAKHPQRERRAQWRRFSLGAGHRVGGSSDEDQELRAARIARAQLEGEHARNRSFTTLAARQLEHPEARRLSWGLGLRRRRSSFQNARRAPAPTPLRLEDAEEDGAAVVDAILTGIDRARKSSATGQSLGEEKAEEGTLVPPYAQEYLRAGSGSAHSSKKSMEVDMLATFPDCLSDGEGDFAFANPYAEERSEARETDYVEREQSWWYHRPSPEVMPSTPVPASIAKAISREAFEDKVRQANDPRRRSILGLFSWHRYTQERIEGPQRSAKKRLNANLLRDPHFARVRAPHPLEVPPRRTSYRGLGRAGDRADDLLQAENPMRARLRRARQREEGAQRASEPSLGRQRSRGAGFLSSAAVFWTMFRRPKGPRFSYQSSYQSSEASGGHR